MRDLDIDPYRTDTSEPADGRPRGGALDDDEELEPTIVRGRE
ncbi:hypothetical protein ACWGRK_12030 [Saccharomonospora azurea]|uniref:Uncharacterized protein n=1 Tax=Saccharomonospora azurea NA-128 TaxID=882081 RepID=H8G952_9PSEU|nr:hypothetical protein [Saccharomonospora azurea]EHY90533.1 hypothetical protein SacazDRAFT_03669 [Saccharomonospora azurea NA-128]